MERQKKEASHASLFLMVLSRFHVISYAIALSNTALINAFVWS